MKNIVFTIILLLCTTGCKTYFKKNKSIASDKEKLETYDIDYVTKFPQKEIKIPTNFNLLEPKTKVEISRRPLNHVSKISQEEETLIKKIEEIK